jgi:hypothetical protein
MNLRKHAAVTFALGSLLGGAPVYAGPEYNLANALDFAGFDLIGRSNPLSGGIDFLATTNFSGAPFDFGAWDLSLSGPLSLQVSTGGRLINQFDLSLTTAVNARADATPLAYVYNYDVGPQTGQVSGTVLMDVDFSINKFGFYDIGVNYSSRQQTTTEGRFSNDTSTDDFDLGPIRISGNIFADILAVLTDPFFDRAGAPNIFASFSGNEALSNILLGSSADPEQLLASLTDLAAPDAAVFRAINDWPGSASAAAMNPTSARTFAVVPEPAVLVLMLLGLPIILAHPRRRRNVS